MCHERIFGHFLWSSIGSTGTFSYQLHLFTLASSMCIDITRYWSFSGIYSIFCLNVYVICLNDPLNCKDDDQLDYTVEVVGLSPIKGPCCFLEQETLPLLLSTGWFQERIRAWFHNQTKINWGPYGRLT